MRHRTAPRTVEQVAALMEPIHGPSRWQAAVGFDGYFVSDLGQIWSCRSQRLIFGHRCGQKGYKYIGRRTRRGEYLHRIICRTFHGEPAPPKDHARHLDGDIENNRASNLAWGTRQENESDKLLHGTLRRGEQVAGSKLSPSTITKMREARASADLSYREVAELFGVGTSAAHRALTGRTWSHLA